MSQESRVGERDILVRREGSLKRVSKAITLHCQIITFTLIPFSYLPAMDPQCFRLERYFQALNGNPEDLYVVELIQ